MKKLLVITMFITGWINMLAQDSFQEELFSANMVLKYQTEINLSNQQIDKVKKIYHENITDLRSMKSNLDIALEMLAKHIATSLVDEKAMLVQMQKVTHFEAQLKQANLSMLIRIKNELSQSQQNKLKDLRTNEDMINLLAITPMNETQVESKNRNKNKSDAGLPIYVIKNKNGELIISSMEGIDPSTIKNMSVLKGEPAIQAYGEGAKNGVVVIELKE